MTTKLLWMALVVATGALVGCGDASTPPAEVKTGDQAELADIRQSCDVFTLDMARQILGDSAMRSVFRCVEGD